MATNRNSEHLRYRYGICLNDNCQKCKNKEVQQVSARKDFVCEECGKPLRECPPPKSGPDKIVIAAIAVVIVIAAGIGLFFGFSGGDTPEPTAVDSLAVQGNSQPQSSDTVTVVKTDTVVVKEQIPVQQKATSAPATKTAEPKAVSAKSNGKVRLSYGSYSGDMKNGYPDGMGRLTYSTSRVINKYDSKKRTANAGDYVIGEFVNGYFVQGKHYSPNGDLIETLMIGTPATSDYDRK